MAAFFAVHARTFLPPVPLPVFVSPYRTGPILIILWVRQGTDNCYELFSDRTFARIEIVGVLKKWPSWHRHFLLNSRALGGYASWRIVASPNQFFQQDRLMRGCFGNCWPFSSLVALAILLPSASCLFASGDFDRPNTYFGNADWDGGLDVRGKRTRRWPMARSSGGGKKAGRPALACMRS